jgi:hypothetical protein
VQVESPQLGFPQTFCCNCGVTDCAVETQDTRVTRFFGIGNNEMTFKLSVPVCAACRKSSRRRPAGFFSRLGVLAASLSAAYVTLLVLSLLVALPTWIFGNVLAISVILALLFSFVFYALRRPKPPQTSFYQPVRIKNVRLQVTGLMAGEGQVGFMKLAFSNPDYLNMFVNANEDAIKARRIAVVKA